MAEGDSGNGDAGKGPSRSANFGFLTRKIGPLPIWAYAAIAVGIYYWYTHYGPGASKKQNQNNPTDPQTGQPYAQEVGSLQEKVKIIQSQPRTRTGTGDRDTDHDKAKEKKINPGGPEKGPGPIGNPPPNGDHDHDHDKGSGGGQDGTVIQTRWRGPYRAPKSNQVEYVPAEPSEPDHRPLGI